jgi:Lrp/AsnC family transcriptional regulator
LGLDDISERVNLSRNSCWRRIKILEDQGYIRKRVALLDPEKLDLGLQVFIHVKTANHSSDWAANLATVTRAIPEITAVHRMSGNLDYLIHAWVRDMKSYDHL